MTSKTRNDDCMYKVFDIFTRFMNFTQEVNPSSFSSISKSERHPYEVVHSAQPFHETHNASPKLKETVDFSGGTSWEAHL